MDVYRLLRSRDISGRWVVRGRTRLGQTYLYIMDLWNVGRSHGYSQLEMFFAGNVECSEEEKMSIGGKCFGNTLILQQVVMKRLADGTWESNIMNLCGARVSCDAEFMDGIVMQMSIETGDKIVKFGEHVRLEPSFLQYQSTAWGTFTATRLHYPPPHSTTHTNSSNNRISSTSNCCSIRTCSSIKSNTVRTSSYPTTSASIHEHHTTPLTEACSINSSRTSSSCSNSSSISSSSSQCSNISRGTQSIHKLLTHIPEHTNALDSHSVSSTLPSTPPCTPPSTPPSTRPSTPPSTPPSSPSLNHLSELSPGCLIVLPSRNYNTYTPPLPPCRPPALILSSPLVTNPSSLGSAYSSSSGTSNSGYSSGAGNDQVRFINLCQYEDTRPHSILIQLPDMPKIVTLCSFAQRQPPPPRILTHTKHAHTLSTHTPRTHTQSQNTSTPHSSRTPTSSTDTSAHMQEGQSSKEELDSVWGDGEWMEGDLFYGFDDEISSDCIVTCHLSTLTECVSEGTSHSSVVEGRSVGEEDNRIEGIGRRDQVEPVMHGLMKDAMCQEEARDMGMWREPGSVWRGSEDGWSASGRGYRREDDSKETGVSCDSVSMIQLTRGCHEATQAQEPRTEEEQIQDGADELGVRGCEYMGECGKCVSKDEKYRIGGCYYETNILEHMSIEILTQVSTYLYPVEWLRLRLVSSSLYTLIQDISPYAISPHIPPLTLIHYTTQPHIDTHTHYTPNTTHTHTTTPHTYTHTNTHSIPQHTHNNTHRPPTPLYAPSQSSHSHHHSPPHKYVSACPPSAPLLSKHITTPCHLTHTNPPPVSPCSPTTHCNHSKTLSPPPGITPSSLPVCSATGNPSPSVPSHSRSPVPPHSLKSEGGRGVGDVVGLYRQLLELDISGTWVVKGEYSPGYSYEYSMDLWMLPRESSLLDVCVAGEVNWTRNQKMVIAGRMHGDILSLQEVIMTQIYGEWTSNVINNCVATLSLDGGFMSGTWMQMGVRSGPNIILPGTSCTPHSLSPTFYQLETLTSGTFTATKTTSALTQEHPSEEVWPTAILLSQPYQQHTRPSTTTTSTDDSITGTGEERQVFTAASTDYSMTDRGEGRMGEEQHRPRVVVMEAGDDEILAEMIWSEMNMMDSSSEEDEDGYDLWTDEDEDAVLAYRNEFYDDIIMEGEGAGEGGGNQQDEQFTAGTYEREQTREEPEEGEEEEQQEEDSGREADEEQKGQEEFMYGYGDTVGFSSDW
eukprot:GHVQ01020697.1.p1 GENE.GHVQ01020697.1~~GHVQ01020697.1.p1  ORF type:complete len:1297 (+),score=310.93 GHVQ01020697.1:194-3892(+)